MDLKHASNFARCVDMETEFYNEHLPGSSEFDTRDTAMEYFQHYDADVNAHLDTVHYEIELGLIVPAAQVLAYRAQQSMSEFTLELQSVVDTFGQSHPEELSDMLKIIDSVLEAQAYPSPSPPASGGSEPGDSAEPAGAEPSDPSVEAALQALEASVTEIAASLIQVQENFDASVAPLEARLAALEEVAIAEAFF